MKLKGRVINVECIEFKINNEISAAEYISDQHSEIIVLSHGLSGNGGTIYSYYEYFDKQNKGVLSFDYPCHGYRNDNYKNYTVDNCLNTLNEVYKYLIKKYPNKKISFLGTSLGSLYLYKYILDNKPKIEKVLFKCMPLENSKNMTKMFLNDENKDKDYFTVFPGLDLPKTLLNELKTLEYGLKEIDYLSKEKILFIHGTADKLANFEKTKDFCEKFNYNLKVVYGGDHNFKENNSKSVLMDTINEFLGE